MTQFDGYARSPFGSEIGPVSDDDEIFSNASGTSADAMDMGEGQNGEGRGESGQAADNFGKTTAKQDDCDRAVEPIPGSTRESQEKGDPTTPTGPASKRNIGLLDLPCEILKYIIKEVTHTNDLTSVALSCSTLHAVAIPNMYSRFDIVWPENSQSSDHSAGVDALSHGLATLVMSEDVFHGLPPFSNRSMGNPRHCSCNCHEHPNTKPSSSNAREMRRGNYYAQYTRTFSIGNGPPSWVKEYALDKDAGKMLGTLVALAVARMVNLESFTWDMPTGVLRDVWMALSSLADRPGHPCRLERVWVRWHDNFKNSLQSAAGRQRSLGLAGMPSSPHLPLSSMPILQRYGSVEYPTLSVLPPLRSLSVLNIDEPSYLDELAVLIERSRDRLKELRIGLACRICGSPWVKPAGEITWINAPTGWPKAGGVLQVLTGAFDKASSSSSSGSTSEKADPKAQHGSAGIQSHQVGDSSSPAEANDNVAQQGSTYPDSPNTPSSHGVDTVSSTESGDPLFQTPEQQLSVNAQDNEHIPQDSGTFMKNHDPRESKSSPVLKLEILELERVYLSTPILLRVLDWTNLTSLTILGCEGHEKLWKALRRQYAPSSPGRSTKHATHEGGSSYRFPLALKHIHTDTVSTYLLLLIKDTLAPNTLESVYFHDISHHMTNISVNAIYRNVLLKHRMSLKRVLLDTLERRVSSNRWRRWMFNRKMISFVTSGKMPQLRELSMAIEVKNWHHFIQRLPGVPQLRALHISNIDWSHPQGVKELALQILDVVTIRPEISISYIAIQNKCYEIYEDKRGDKSDDSDSEEREEDLPGLLSVPSEDEDEEDGIDDEEDDEFFEEDNVVHGGDGVDSDSDPSLSMHSLSDGDETGSESGRSQVAFGLREILFYDDKIGIFEARHGTL